MLFVKTQKIFEAVYITDIVVLCTSFRSGNGRSVSAGADVGYSEYRHTEGRNRTQFSRSNITAGL